MATLFATGPGQLPVGGKIDPNFVPVYSQLTGFVDASGNPTTDTTQSPVFNGNTINLFGLQVPRHFVTPSTQQWNLLLEHSLPANWVAELGYVGTKGTHLRETRDAIQAVDATVTPVTLTATDGSTFVVNQNSLANVNARSRALGLGAGGYQLFANDANSIYHSLQATLSHRFRSGFHFQAAYTFSHAIDETSTGNTAFNSAVNDQTSLRDSRGLSDFDRTHRLTINYYYQLPALQDSGAFVRRVLGSWFVSGITTFQSGTPFTVIDSNAGGAFGLLGTGTPTTPDLVTSISDAQTHGSIQDRLNGFLNINAFAPAPVVGVDGTEGFGTLGRNRFRGPRQQNWDFTLGKVFHMTERQQLRFTSDFFNLFNHPNFSNPAFLDIESPSNFGQIVTTTGTPRLIQFSARYAF
jgi:hypothetical protein